MNTGRWTITRSEEFDATIASARREIEKALFACGDSIPDAEKISIAQLERLEHLDAFLEAIERLENGRDHPSKVLRQVLNAQHSPIPRLYVLNVGQWVGYFHLDGAKRFGVGLLAFEGMGVEKTVEKLFKALRSV